MALPELDLARIRRWCSQQVPAHLHDQLQIVAEESPRHVTIHETRPPWDGSGDWTRSPVARLRYTKASGLWSLYWCDRNLKFHLYDRFPETATVQDMLDYLGSGIDPVFFG